MAPSGTGFASFFLLCFSSCIAIVFFIWTFSACRFLLNSLALLTATVTRESGRGSEGARRGGKERWEGAGQEDEGQAHGKRACVCIGGGLLETLGLFGIIGAFVNLTGLTLPPVQRWIDVDGQRRVDAQRRR